MEALKVSDVVTHSEMPSPQLNLVAEQILQQENNPLKGEKRKQFLRLVKESVVVANVITQSPEHLQLDFDLVPEKEFSNMVERLVFTFIYMQEGYNCSEKTLRERTDDYLQKKISY